MLSTLRLSIAALSLGFVTITANCSFAQETTFRWKFKSGQQLLSEVTQTIEQGLPNSPNPVTQSFNLQQRWQVVAVDANQAARMRTILDRVQLTMNIPGAGEVVVDTDKPADQENGLAGQLGKMFRPMIGQPCENDMQTTGKISNVSIPEEAMSGFKNLPLGDSMSSVLTDSIEKGSPVFPDQAIGPGYSWTQEHSTKTPVGSMKAINKLTYVGPEVVDGKQLHKFDMDLTVSFSGDNPSATQIEIPEQSSKGTMYFDNENGYLVSTELDQSMKMLIKVAGQNEVESTTVQKMKTTFKPFTGR